MNTEFNWWLLIVGLVLGAGLVWLVLAITRRDELDVTERERQSEARWIGEAMRNAGRRIDDADALDVLRLHEAYLSAPPPDEIDDEDEVDRVTERSGSATRAAAAEARPPMAHRLGAAEPVEGTRPER